MRRLEDQWFLAVLVINEGSGHTDCNKSQERAAAFISHTGAASGLAAGGLLVLGWSDHQPRPFLGEQSSESLGVAS